ncbi:MAG TPA: prepilin-type N-terminal cleavage/methylation domain-containing protein [Chitinispirillaceae bacterium]|jgi:prepilin-type N-terminal cleavage/methylation domain-containing protein|nr:prepilin-type N-terminal cleavage/methylation domain-containing protein [Chitinispirillaceae bacterium]
MVKKLSLCCKRGFTVIELITALALSSIVISSVYYFWNFLNKHVYTHSRHAQVEQEAHRAAQQIFSSINKSSEIIEWDPQSITFISTSGDTNKYLYDSDSLRYNRSAMQFSNKGLKVYSFNLRDIDENMINESQHLFLELSIVFLHNERDTVTIEKIIRSTKPKEEAQSFW